MRPPHTLIDNVAFVAETADEIIEALGASCSIEEANEIRRLLIAGLPPITSENALAVLMGFNPGFIWSIINRPTKHYRFFSVPKGGLRRNIEAPRIALKLIQKWLSVQFERTWKPHDSIHGFVRGRSHISAAEVHLSANWVISIDIENFFPSTQIGSVKESLIRIGYRRDESLAVILGICCIRNRLPQEAPSSPVIANISLHPIDERIAEIAGKYDAKFTRYADDIVFSGRGAIPTELVKRIEDLFSGTSWRLSDRKRHIAVAPQRLKVHGLLVHGDKLRLTKGYRNRIRAYRHLLAAGRINEADIPRILGHIQYAEQVN